MRIAAFSDTHGNLLGLEAVLADIERRGPFDRLLMGGDLVHGGPRPAETLARIQALSCPVVVGNTDAYLFVENAARSQAGVKPKEYPMLEWTAQQIGPEGVAYLRALPFSHHLPGPDGGVCLVHANPDDLETPIGPYDDAADLARRLAAVQEPVLLFGHLHISYQRRVGRWLLVDIASAGFPRDHDQRVAWAEVWHDGASWQATLHRVPYDLDAVLEQLRTCGLPNAKKRIKILREARYGKS